MKKIALVLLCVVGTACAVFYYHIMTTDESDIQVASQQDTKIDNESSRDTFEYFLSGFGEADLDTLKQHFQTYNDQQANAYQLDTDLFEKLIQYKAALQTLEPLAFEQLDIDSLQQLNDQIISLQLRFFSQEEQAKLFAEENQLRDLALKQLKLKQQATSEEDFQNQWQQEIDDLPPELQKSYQNAQLLSRLQSTKIMNSQERFLANQELVGTDAANRLEVLAEKRTAFKQKLTQYLEQRAEIKADLNLNIDEQQEAIGELRKTSFSATQQRRILALESIHDDQIAVDSNG
ncbi:lipase chaperone [Photobacterium sp. SDRW27]|uniref:lipase secretion chaperone n=1 Tax=Photobacterium obscurum TaxID=2829490 RepID=UPI00224470E7|nr:lipase secretion chaperone [Photobacterium obscurum]MCW8329988.1 lipase chaperone [Photobacterium obscurum]